MYSEAYRIFESCEAAAQKTVNFHATLDPNIINFEEESRAEMRNRRRGKMRWIPPR